MIRMSGAQEELILLAATGPYSVSDIGYVVVFAPSCVSPLSYALFRLVRSYRYGSCRVVLRQYGLDSCGGAI